MGTSFHTYIGQCCREWPLAAGYPVGRCGICGEVPEFLREDDRCSCAHCADAPIVCIAHGRFIPCRKDGEHDYTGSPAWVKAVRDYQASTSPRATWEPVRDPHHCPDCGVRLTDCGPRCRDCVAPGASDDRR